MREGVLRFDTCIGVNDEHLAEEVDGSRLHLLILLALQGKLEFLVVSVHLVVLRPLKQRFPHEQDVKNGSQREDVACGLDMLRLRETDDFWGDVAGCTTAEEEVFLEIHVAGKSEVDDHWLQGVSSQHDVLGLQVPMHHPLVVDVPQTRQQSPSDCLYLRCSEVSLAFLDGLEEGLSGQQLQDHIDGVIRLVYCFQFEDIGVWFSIELSQHCQFVNQTLLPIFGTVGILLRKGLHSKSHLICHSFGLIDSCEVSFAQFADGLEHFMEAGLIDSFFEDTAPSVCCSFLKVEFQRGLFLIVESDAYLSRGDVFLNGVRSTSTCLRIYNLIQKVRGRWWVASEECYKKRVLLASFRKWPEG